MAAEITLRNPLPETLEDCCFSIEGANLTGGRVICERSRFHQQFSPPFNIKNKKFSLKGIVHPEMEIYASILVLVSLSNLHNCSGVPQTNCPCSCTVALTILRW